MATKCIDFYSKHKLNCPDCVPAEAILCIPPELTPTTVSTIAAELTFWNTVVNKCGNSFFHYKFEYDDAQLVPGTILKTSDITGAFCKDCFAAWVEDFIAPITIVTSDTELRTANLVGCGEIWIETPITLLANLTLVTPIFVAQCGMLITDGFTLQFDASLRAGTYQIFDTSPGEVQFLERGNAPILPEWFGAVGDIITNNSDAIEQAAASLVQGGSIFFGQGEYYIQDSFSFTNNFTTIEGTGKSSKLRLNDGVALTVAASGFTAHDLWIDGTDYSTGTATGRLLSFAGTVGAPLSLIEIRDCFFSNATFYGVLLNHVFDFQIVNNEFRDSFFAPIFGNSISDGHIEGNTFKNVLGLSAGIAYGISIARDTGTEVASPRSHHVAVSNNIFINIPNGPALEVRSATDIVFSGNITFECLRGVLVRKTTDGGNPNLAPQRVLITDNSFYGVSTGTFHNALLISGDEGAAGSPNELAYGCIVSDNYIYGYGEEDQTGAAGSALYAYATYGLIITGNNFTEPSPRAMYFLFDNYGLLVTDNFCVDPWTDNAGSAGFARFEQDYNTGFFADNVATQGPKVAADVLTECYLLDSTSPNSNLYFGNHLYTGVANAFLNNRPAAYRQSEYNRFPQGYYMAAVPAAGTWNAGDHVWNNAPAVGQPIGWICTVGGGPGTWVAMANL